jgi:hypothetical protein
LFGWVRTNVGYELLRGLAVGLTLGRPCRFCFSVVCHIQPVQAKDLYKKTMSADGISGRKPYGVTTRMYELIGWKRLESNKAWKFSGSPELRHDLVSIVVLKFRHTF